MAKLTLAQFREMVDTIGPGGLSRTQVYRLRRRSSAHLDWLEQALTSTAHDGDDPNNPQYYLSLPYIGGGRRIIAYPLVPYDPSAQPAEFSHLRRQVQPWLDNLPPGIPELRHIYAPTPVARQVRAARALELMISHAEKIYSPAELGGDTWYHLWHVLVQQRPIGNWCKVCAESTAQQSAATVVETR